MYKVIMAPTEGSDTENSAISVGVKLAQRFHADLRLVRVQSSPLTIETIPRQPVLESTEQTLVDERVARLRKLESLGIQLRALGDIKVITALEDGPVGPTLRDYATKFNVDLIVMPSHARGRISRITLGSVTDYLIRRTNIPVLVVRQPASFLGATREETVSRIVVPLDGSALAAQILGPLCSLARELNSTVSLVQVLTPVTYAQQQIMQPGLPWWDADMTIAKEYLSDAASYLRAEGVSVTTDVILGEDVSATILEYAARTRADIIALATSGSGGMNRFVFGTVADEVARKSPVSVLVFHPRQHIVGEMTAGGLQNRLATTADVSG